MLTCTDSAVIEAGKDKIKVVMETGFHFILAIKLREEGEVIIQVGHLFDIVAQQEDTF